MKSIFKAVGGRKVACAILSALVVIANAYYDLGLDVQELLIAVGNFAVFIGVEGLGDTLERWATSGKIDKLEKIADSLLGDDEEKGKGDNSDSDS